MVQNYLTPLYIALIVVYIAVLTMSVYIFSHFSRSTRNSKKLFITGFAYKIFMGLVLALILDFYYNREVDSFDYFESSSYLGEMLFNNTKAYFRMLFDTVTPENINTISHTINYYPRFSDPQKYAVHRYVSMFTIIGLKNYYLTTICISATMYLLNWKVFDYLARLYPNRRTWIALAVLFIPSVTIWSTGITKDTFSFTFGLIFFVCFHKIFIMRRYRLINIFVLLLSAYIVVTIKPYVLFVYITAGILWFGVSSISRVRNRVLRLTILPVISTMLVISAVVILGYFMDRVGGAYGSIEAMLQKASVAQFDLKQDYYQGSAFDIGSFEPTLQGALSVMPAAVIAGLFRPFLWDATSSLMVFSALENTVLIIMFLYVIFKVGPVATFKIIRQHKIILFFLLFTIFMAIGIGLSTSNFGALVRFKTPHTPFFFLGMIFIILEYKERMKVSNDNSHSQPIVK